MTDLRKPIFDAIRAARGEGFDTVEVGLVDALLDELDVPRAFDLKVEGNLVVGSDPPWIVEGRRIIGASEIPGPKHNNWIAKGWARLGAGWFNDDETPWCGFFVAHCIDKAGLPYPKGGLFARAKAWLDWGKSCRPVYGAVVVFGREGGGHVGFLVGASTDHYYVLGGNQSNAVNITPIAKYRALGYRWPASLPIGTSPLPRMAGGTVSRNEA